MSELPHRAPVPLWTAKRPTQPYFYWLWRRGEISLDIIRVDEDERGDDISIGMGKALLTRLPGDFMDRNVQTDPVFDDCLFCPVTPCTNPPGWKHPSVY